MPEDMAERFTKDISGWTSNDGKEHIPPHQMTVLRDDGLYRHLRFASPGRGFYWFDLITWPGCLVINGDVGTFTFSRDPDMFAFFRGDRINPGYWAEKVRGTTRVAAYSKDLFRQYVKEETARAEENYPGLTAAAEEYFYGVPFPAEWDTERELDARRALDEFRYVPRGATKAEPFTFTDSWEWNLHDYHWTFLWCCHAIRWGIAQYDKPGRRSPAGGNTEETVNA